MIKMTHIHAQVGSPFKIRLAVVPTAGYEWTLVSQPTVCAFLESSTEGNATDLPAGPPHGRYGGVGGVVFHFRAVRTGSEVLKFTMSRPWDDAVAAEHFAHVTVTA